MPDSTKVRLVVPTGRMYAVVRQLLEDAGLVIKGECSGYRPVPNDDRFEVKLLKAANIPKLIEYRAHDIGFSGYDWVRETAADVEILLDTELLPVRVVAAAPVGWNPLAAGGQRPVVVASEYERITRSFLTNRGIEFRFVRTYGATEVFPPEDADLIVDNVSSGRTLAANGLEIIEEIFSSSTLLLGCRAALLERRNREVIDELVMLIQSVLNARQRVLLDMNVTASCLDSVVQILPAMKSPTVQRLYGRDGYAVRAAVDRTQVDRLIPQLRKAGATDLLQTAIQRVIA